MGVFGEIGNKTRGTLSFDAVAKKTQLTSAESAHHVEAISRRCPRFLAEKLRRSDAERHVSRKPRRWLEEFLF